MANVDETINTHTIIARVPYKLHKAVVAKSRLTGNSVSTIVRDALTTKLGVVIGDTPHKLPPTRR